MDLRYVMYVNDGKRYYEPQLENVHKTMFKIPDLPETWKHVLDEFNHWMYCFGKDTEIPEQGWKIHITTALESAQNMLDKVAPFLIENSVQFKYVSNKWELFLKNSKYGDRGSSGKFITIYPKTDKQFEFLVCELEKLLSGSAPGPYILNDKRWKDTNIFFRYGGFAEMFTSGANRVLAIRNSAGVLVEDPRGPSYMIPEFIEEPEFVKKMDEERELQITEESRIDDYKIEEAIHFSNGGGVYTGFLKDSTRKVVLKEGRPGAGLDGLNKDGYLRVEHEANILQRLKGMKYVAEFIEIFKAWEHIFLVEEYISGSALSSWLSVNYPFANDDVTEYCNKCCIILRELILALREMHSRGVGMGDLQPMNIMVQTDYTIKLIDFEAAGDIDCQQRIGLQTPGFATPDTKTRRQADWFAATRIARNVFLPISPVQDLDERILVRHDKWIEKQFPIEAIKLIKEIDEEYQKTLSINNIYESPITIEETCNKIRAGIIEDLKVETVLVPGDIRLYEENGGSLSVLYGGYGVVLAMHRTGKIPKKCLEWIDFTYDIQKLAGIDNGLYYGKAGIASVLYEIGQTERAKEIFDSIDYEKNRDDITLWTGLAGIGLAFLAVSQKEGFEDYIEKALDIAKRIRVLFEGNAEIKKQDPDSISVGIFQGWSGASFFFASLYRIVKEQEWLDISISTLNKDLEQCDYDPANTFNTKDGNRFFPYFAGGTLGIGLCILELRKITNKNIWQSELEGIIRILNSRCCYNPGLFRGIAGFLVFGNATNIYEDLQINLERTLDALDLSLINEYDCLYIPGDYGYKYSGDIFSGAAGVLLTLHDICNRKCFSWLPIINANEFLAK